MFIFFLALIANVCEKYCLLIAAKKKKQHKNTPYFYCYVNILTVYRKFGMKKKFQLIDIAIVFIFMCVLC